MLSVEHAREVATRWRPQFVDESNFETSWTKFFGMVGDPTADKLEAWLAKDQAKDAVIHAGIVREPLLPTVQDVDLRTYDALVRGTCPRCGGDPAACATCHGLGFVRRDLPVGHAEFGRVVRCPRCGR